MAHEKEPRLNQSSEPQRFTNRLANESSPYLLQHAHNPVDWHPWGEEAFELARKENKAIFLSVGYSTCYWCHVMERECFEDETIAAEMNKKFINIKVDRDLRPFYGWTYFPPTDMHGRPGFVTVLRGIEDAYRNRPADVKQTADRLNDI